MSSRVKNMVVANVFLGIQNRAIKSGRRDMSLSYRRSIEHFRKMDW
jgi:hypothetical protein